MLSSHSTELLKTLLSSVIPSRCGGPEVLRPLWAYESMQRAYNLIELVALLDLRSRESIRGSIDVALENGNATALAKSYQALNIVDEIDHLLCSGLLRTMAHGLVELFGTPIGNVVLKTQIAPLSLSAIRRRALVLVCNELLVNALRHAFVGRSDGRIKVTLGSLNHRRRYLVVSDNGNGMTNVASRTPGDIVSDLACLLDGEIQYRSVDPHGLEVVISFDLERVDSDLQEMGLSRIPCW
jgi:two-component sensor histidine kinase